MNTTRRKVLRALLSGMICAAMMVAGCGKPTAESASLTKVRFSTSKNVWCSLALLADAKGFFREEGLDVELSYTDGGRYCMDALLSDSADVGNIVETNVSYLGYRGNNTVLVVANVVRSTSIAIVARRSSGINELNDLVGKRLAYVPGMQGEIFANRVLKKHNIDVSKIDVQKLQPKAIPPALDSGNVDAASTWEPFVYACTRALGDDAVVFRDAKAHKGYMHLAVRRQWAKDNPETLKSVLRALKKADSFAAQHTDEAHQILAEIMHVDVELVKAIWPYFEVRLEFDAAEVEAAIQAEGEWVRESQADFKGKPLPDYSMYVDGSYMADIK